MSTKDARGFYLLEAAVVDEVSALAKRLPEMAASYGGVEIPQAVDHG